jgi:multiple sugar transport system substrate-binding protein
LSCRNRNFSCDRVAPAAAEPRAEAVGQPVSSEIFILYFHDKNDQTYDYKEENILKKVTSVFTAALLTLASCFSLSGCATGAANTESSVPDDGTSPVTLTFWAGTVTSDRDAVYKQFVNEVHKKYSNITIDYLGVPGSWSSFDQKLNVAISAGTAPDISNHFLASRIKNGYYLALDSYFDAWADKDSVNSNLVTATRNYDQKDHKLYALPYGTQIQIMWERPDVLKAADLSSPSNWDTFFKEVKTLKDTSTGQFGTSIRGGAGSASELEFLMYSYSGITNYFDSKGKSTINDPKNVEFVQKYLGLYNTYTPEDDLTKSWTQLASAFQTGKAVFVAHNLGSASSMAKAFGNDTSKFEAIPLPKSVQGTQVHCGLQPSAMCVSSSTKDKQAAFNAITVYLDKDLQVAYSKVWGEIPANKDSGNDSFFKKTPYMQVGMNLLNSSSTKFSDTPYYLPNYASIETQVEPLIQKVMSKQMSAKEMLDTWAQLLEKDRNTYESQAGKK